MLVLRRSLPLRVLCLLLIAAVLCFSIFMPMAEAFVFAGPLAYGAVELISAILIGCGIVATTSDDARSMARQVYEWLSSNASSILDTINNIVGAAAGVNVNAGIRVSGGLVDAIKQAVADLTTTSDDGQKVLGSSVLPSPDGYPTYDYFINTMFPQYIAFGRVAENQIDKFYSMQCVAVLASRNHVYFLASIPFVDSSGWNDVLMGDLIAQLEIGSDNASVEYEGQHWRLNMWTQENTGIAFLDDIFFSTCNIYDKSGNLKYSASGGVVSIPYEGDIVSPSDDYLVRVPDLPDVQTDEDGQEVVVYPDLSLNPSDHLADIPQDAAGEVVDVPYDTLVDVGTGEIVGEGEGEGTGEDVENPDIPATDTGTIQSILDKITNFFDSPSDFKLDFDGFKNLILPDRFPFCIPFDLIDSIRVFAADAADFQFSIDLDTSYFSVHHTVDLTPFAVPIAFFRYTCIAFWVWVLITRTRDLMKW